MALKNKKSNFSEWYTEALLSGEFIDYSRVSGAHIYRPNSFSVWEYIHTYLDKKFKRDGVKNSYFPLLIPEKLLNKESNHVEGFSPEVAWVTHTGKSKLKERLAIRPTSETVMYDCYSKWIRSWKDLPLRLNQWANVVRWEMRTRLFLRTAEFLWQEGHTAHATKIEAQEETEKIINLYSDFAQNFMAMPVIIGSKSENERFAGALDTLTIEALMQDGKALQAGTSHFLGQNFAKAFDVKFATKNGTQEYVWATSWGVSTRLMGALVMTHSDDKGLVLPPKLAPFQVVIVPIYKSDEQFDEISSKINEIKKSLESRGVSVKFDNRKTHKPGWKFAEYELKGVPVRLAMGMRDIENKTIEVARRDTLTKETVSIENIENTVMLLLDEIQESLFNKASIFRKENTYTANSYDEFKKLIENGGFVYAHWDCTSETEEKLKIET